MLKFLCRVESLYALFIALGGLGLIGLLLTKTNKVLEKHGYVDLGWADYALLSVPLLIGLTVAIFLIVLIFEKLRLKKQVVERPEQISLNAAQSFASFIDAKTFQLFEKKNQEIRQISQDLEKTKSDVLSKESEIIGMSEHSSRLETLAIMERFRGNQMKAFALTLKDENTNLNLLINSQKKLIGLLNESHADLKEICENDLRILLKPWFFDNLPNMIEDDSNKLIDETFASIFLRSTIRNIVSEFKKKMTTLEIKRQN